MSSGYYRIPRFQRPFSWTQENIHELWDDISRNDPADYFIGSMVVFRSGPQHYDVVDGQQRLTTIALFLAVLRDTFGTAGLPDLAEGVRRLINKHNIDNKEELVIAPQGPSPFFQEHVLACEAPISTLPVLREEDNLRQAHEQLGALVHGVVSAIAADPSLSEDQKREASRKRLIRIRDAILSLKVILVTLDDEDDAYIIFETLNTRGKDLGLSDLVKNHLMKILKTRSASVDAPRRRWQTLLQTLETSTVDLDADVFLHHAWLSRYEYLPARKVYKALKGRVTERSEADAFLDSLVKDAELYRAIHEVGFRKWSKQERRIADSLAALQLFKVAQQTPYVLSLVRAHGDGRIQMRHLREALLDIEKFHFLFTAVTSQRSSGGISGMYAALGRRVWEARDLKGAQGVIADAKAKLRERVPSFEEVKALFPLIIYTERATKQRGLVKYILSGFQRNVPVGVTPDTEAMTIEHIAPQSRIGTDGFTAEIIGQLGNLLLVDEKMNAKLKDKAFPEKRRILEKALCPLPTRLRRAKEWTPEEISIRRREMADEAYRSIWKI